MSGRRGPRTDGNASSSPLLYGCSGRSKIEFGIAELSHLAGIHDHHAIGVVRDDRHVMRDEDDGEAELLLQLLDLGHQRALRDDIERRSRLIHDHELRREEQRHRDHGPLAHAATQLMRIALQMRSIDADKVQHFG